MLKPNEFYSYSPRQFSLAITGYNDKIVDEYRRIRLIMFTMVKLHGDPKTSPKSPEALWPLPGDPDASVKEDELKDFYNRYQNERSRNKG